MDYFIRAPLSRYTDNQWPRVRVAVTRLFLPVGHVALALCFGLEHLSGSLSARGLLATALGAFDRLTSPILSGRVGRDVLAALTAWSANLDLPFEATAVLYYAALLAIIVSLMVRRRGAAPGRGAARILAQCD